MDDRSEIIADKNMRSQPVQGTGLLDGKFWFLIVVMVAAIAVGGVFLS